MSLAITPGLDWGWASILGLFGVGFWGWSEMRSEGRFWRLPEHRNRRKKAEKHLELAVASLCELVMFVCVCVERERERESE